MSESPAGYFALLGRVQARQRAGERGHRLEESFEQQALIRTAWLYRRHPVYGIINACLVAVPNGADCARKLDERTGEWVSPNRQRLLAEGMRPGYPDLLLDVARGGWHGLRLEMKSGAGRLSEEQKTRRELLEAEGYYWTLARSSEAAWDELRRYVDGRIERGR